MGMHLKQTKFGHEAERQWLIDHGHSYRGQWVALRGDSMLAAGPNAVEVYRHARGLGEASPYVVFVDQEPEGVSLGF